MQVVFRDVKGYEGLYKISNYGRVWSVRSGRLLKEIHNVYLKTNLFMDGKRYLVGNHRLVAEAFIPNPDGKPQVNHKDGNKFNNRVDNLEWVTISENMKHAHKTGLMPKFKTNKLNEETVTKIRALSGRHNNTEIANMFGVSRSTVSRIVRGKTHKE